MTMLLGLRIRNLPPEKRRLTQIAPGVYVAKEAYEPMSIEEGIKRYFERSSLFDHEHS